MLSCKRMRAGVVLCPIARTLVIAFALSAAGCSADVTRFDFGSKNTTASIPVPPEPVGNGHASSAAPHGLGVIEAPLPPSELSGSPRMASRHNDAPPAASPLAEASSPPSEPAGNYRVVGRRYNTPPHGEPPPERPPRLAVRPPFHEPSLTPSGGTIEVQDGETLYSIGRRYGVPVAAIKEANGLSSDAVRPGQRLVMPAADRTPREKYASAAAPAPPAWDRFSTARETPPAAAPFPATDPPPGWEGRYTVKSGDSLYGVAYQHKVSLEDIKRANGITDLSKVRPGTTLHVPAQPDTAAAPALPNSPPRITQIPARVVNAAPDQFRTPAPTVLSRNHETVDPDPLAAEAAAKFRWPVRGRVIAGFGRRPDGTHNDGVNVAVPHGTDIHAAEAGKVAYAGNELKGYGNLVLIRHANGWVTAYAHADQLLVKANDEVRRGQVIAKAGKTGAVDQPQLHFELRQGTRPVDPVPHLAN
jgi:murein DD-endopeptidase MepM/ murein hydrolase activator NlpD